MNDADAFLDLSLRAGTEVDRDACESLWVDASATRDGIAVPGVAERAHPKFDHSASWVVAGPSGGPLAGFVLATLPGTGMIGDPPDAAVIGLIAVAAAHQGRCLGAKLLNAATSELRDRGHSMAVLHVLVDNHAAVRLYTANRWVPWTEPFTHSLLKRPCQSYVLAL